MRKTFIFVILGLVFVRLSIAQEAYYTAYKEHCSMLDGRHPDFKRAIFITENAFYDNRCQRPPFRQSEGANHYLYR
jgi:hypothetical protein